MPPLAKRKKRVSLFELGKQLIAVGRVKEFLTNLDQRVAEVQEYRRNLMAEDQPYASFVTLRDEKWYGTLLKESIHTASHCGRVFCSMGVSKCGITWLDDSKPGGKPVGPYEIYGSDELLQTMPQLINRNWTSRESLIIRPLSHHVSQIDDCDKELLNLLQEFAFLVIETSPGNYQVWLALPIDTTKLERDRIRSRLLRVLDGADKCASGAMRWPGSINHKPGRENFCVRIVHSNPTRLITAVELAAAGLISNDRFTESLLKPLSVDSRTSPSTWPDHDRCLREAPLKDGSADRSIADKNWAILALARGIPADKVEAKLVEVSEKAKHRPDYAHRTVTYALSVVSDDYLPKAFSGMLKQLENKYEHTSL